MENIKINIDYRVLTDVMPDGKIHQELACSDIFRERMTTISREIYDTKDAQFRNALIQLGWTPPAGA